MPLQRGRDYTAHQETDAVRRISNTAEDRLCQRVARWPGGLTLNRLGVAVEGETHVLDYGLPVVEDVVAALRDLD